MPEQRPVTRKQTETVRTEAGRVLLIRLINELSPPFICEIHPYKERSRDGQKALYRIWLGQISEFTGDDVESLDKFFKKKFLPKRTLQLFGESLPVLGSTSELTVSEMSNYMAQVQVLAAEFGIQLESQNDRIKRMQDRDAAK